MKLINVVLKNMKQCFSLFSLLHQRFALLLRNSLKCCFSKEKNVWKASGRSLERRLEGSWKKVVFENTREMVFFSFFGRKLEGSLEGGLEGSRKEDSS